MLYVGTSQKYFLVKILPSILRLNNLAFVLLSMTLTTLTFYAQASALPNGKILFNSSGGSRGIYNDIWIINADGSEPKNLTNTPDVSEGSPDWSPDGTKIAFDRNSVSICVMNADGTGIKVLTGGGKDYNYMAKWSPDGTKIAFVSSRDGSLNILDIYVMNADGTNVRRLTVSLPLHSSVAPSWSPDGTRIAFSSNRDGINLTNEQIYVMNADGSNVKRLTNNTTFDFGPQWSPDDRKIAFTRRGADNGLDGNFDVFVMNADGSNQTDLTVNNRMDDGSPAWSPDSTRIIFSSSRSIANGYAFGELYIMNADGSDQVNITNTRDFYDTAPAWQPSSRLSGTPSSSVVQFDGASYAADKNAGRITINVTRTGDASNPASVEYCTVNGTASDRSDYLTAAGTLRFAAEETTKSFDVLVVNNAFNKSDAMFILALSNATNSSLGAPRTSVVRITNNSSTSNANPINDTRFFVQQHYMDFLNRVPDDNGQAFWEKQITDCGGDAQCVRFNRAEVSSAYFLSTEFQQTGYLVYRFYKTAFKRLPRLAEFMPDVQTIGRGVVVGAQGWAQKLTENQRTFAEEWVTRADFKVKYPDSLTPTQFVDALFANAGVTPDATERNALIAGLQANIETRANVLRQVAENESLVLQEHNRAFVLMQYFGYLRRNPDDAPDTNIDGYDFWLKKLNNSGGDARKAEMVKSFIESAEYRQRFGQN